MELFAMGFAHRIIIFSDATRVVEYPCKDGLWKVTEQHNVGMYPREQHGIGAKVWPAMARMGCKSRLLRCSPLLNGDTCAATLMNEWIVSEVCGLF
jgi:hypothetical protein